MSQCRVILADCNGVDGKATDIVTYSFHVAKLTRVSEVILDETATTVAVLLPLHLIRHR